MTDKTDNSKVVVPKALRLNMQQRKDIAEKIANKSKAKTLEGYDREKVRKELTKRFYKEIWGGIKQLKKASTFTKGFFPSGAKVSLETAKLCKHETGTRGETSEYISSNYQTFDLSEEITEIYGNILPAHVSTGYLRVTEGDSEKEKKWRESTDGRRSYLVDRQIEKDLYDFVTFGDRVQKAGNALESKALSALKAIKSVRDLQKMWPEAFDAYMELYSHLVIEGGTALVVAAPVSEVSKMIADFPDIEDVMAA